MRHVALFVRDMAACEHFYVELLGMQVEWRPELIRASDTVTLSAGVVNVGPVAAGGETGVQLGDKRLIGIASRNDRLELWLAIHRPARRAPQADSWHGQPARACSIFNTRSHPEPVAQRVTGFRLPVPSPAAGAHFSRERGHAAADRRCRGSRSREKGSGVARSHRHAGTRGSPSFTALWRGASAGRDCASTRQ